MRCTYELSVKAKSRLIPPPPLLFIPVCLSTGSKWLLNTSTIHSLSYNAVPILHMQEQDFMFCVKKLSSDTERLPTCTVCVILFFHHDIAGILPRQILARPHFWRKGAPKQIVSFRLSIIACLTLSVVEMWNSVRCGLCCEILPYGD